MIQEKKSRSLSAYAAIDIGTSFIKCGISVSGIKNNFQIIGRWHNKTVSSAPGQALNSFSHIEKILNQCLKNLGSYCSENKIEVLHIGICGHVSSYLYWNRDTDKPVNDYFPIWSDQSCEPVLLWVKEIFKNNNDFDCLGTFLPPATNWLVTKILCHHNHEAPDNGMILQVSDAIFHRLTRFFFTHFSSAVSIVHQEKGQYSKKLLEILRLSPETLPEISNTTFYNVSDDVRKRFDLPSRAFVFPGIADFHASFAALDLKFNEGFILSNSSEIAGKLLTGKQDNPRNFLITYLQQDRPILYGSTRTGGNIINWFFEKIYRKKLNNKNLSELSARASGISPLSCPLFIPYLEGERAPFWNNNLSGSFSEVKIHQDISHLFRAVLTGIAFARRLTFESMPGDIPEYIKIGGGGARNHIWNQIRSDVLGKPLLVFRESELSVLGTIVLMSLALEDRNMTNYISGLREIDEIKPDKNMAGPYLEQYNKYISYYNLAGGLIK
jgi:sugar (pentulose or hexulose) kinase